MHIVPAPAERLMKSRVLSIPGLQGVKDETWDGYRLFRLSGGASERREVRQCEVGQIKIFLSHFDLSLHSVT